MIRRAQERDIDGVLKLLLQVCQVHADGRPDLFKSGGVKYTAENLKELFKDDTKPVYVYTDETDSQVMGYIFCVYENTDETTSTYAHKTLYIDDLCVEETIRKSGIGKALYNYVEDIARKEGCYRITLHVWECNPSAVKFYSGIGMKPLYTSMETIL